MRFAMMAICAVSCASAANAAAPETGRYSDQLRTMLTQVAAGTCPSDIMGEKLLGACREQLPNMGPELKAAGAIKSLTFVKADQVGDDRVETYKVTFAKGETATWHIGGLRSGKFDRAYSMGD